jgi:ligand-binding SRPBCC domain-containing protein
MTHFEAVQWLPVELPRVFAFFSFPENLPRIMPRELRVTTEWTALVPPSGSLQSVLLGGESNMAAGRGSEFVFSFRPLPFVPMKMQWKARIEEYEPNRFFRDTQLSGPMRHWNHRHEFESETRNGIEGTLIRDFVEFEIGFGWIGKLLARYFVLPAMRSSFEKRQALVERALQF